MIALALSVLFLAAAAAKAADPWSLRLTVRELLPALPRRSTHVLALAVPALELAVALLFVAGSRTAGLVAAAGTVVLAGAFAGAALLARRRPVPVPCRCFGALGPSTLSGRTVLTSAALGLAAVLWPLLDPPLSTIESLPVRLLALLAVPAVLVHRRTATRAGRRTTHAPARRPVPRPSPTEGARP